MGADVIFVDQTLGDSLENYHLSTEKLVSIKGKIEVMHQGILDVALQSIVDAAYLGITDTKNFRIGIQPNMKEVILAYQLGCNHIKVSVHQSEIEEAATAVAEAFLECARRNIKVALQVTGNFTYSVSEVRILCQFVKAYDINSVIFHDAASSFDPADLLFCSN